MNRHIRPNGVTSLVQGVASIISDYWQSRHAEPSTAFSSFVRTLVSQGESATQWKVPVRFLGRGVLQVGPDAAPIYLLMESLSSTWTGSAEDVSLSFRIKISSPDGPRPVESATWVTPPEERPTLDVPLVDGQVVSAGDDLFIFPLRSDVSWEENLAALADFVHRQRDRQMDWDTNSNETAAMPAVDLNWLNHLLTWEREVSSATAAWSTVLYRDVREAMERADQHAREAATGEDEVERTAEQLVRGSGATEQADSDRLKVLRYLDRERKVVLVIVDTKASDGLRKIELELHHAGLAQGPRSRFGPTQWKVQVEVDEQEVAGHFDRRGIWRMERPVTSEQVERLRISFQAPEE